MPTYFALFVATFAGMLALGSASPVQAGRTFVAYPPLQHTAAPAKLQHPIQFMLQGENAQTIANWQQAWRLNGTFPYVSYSVSTPPNWHTLATESFASYATLQADIPSGIAPGVNILLYDNEKWNQTPLDEQASPQTYERMFCQLAHQYHYSCMTAPAPDLVTVQPGGQQWQDYLSDGFPQFSAKYADFYAIQSQGYQQNEAVYQQFVSQAAAQALSANHNVWVLAGLSTNPNPDQGVPTLAILSADIANTRSSLAGGYWLNIPTPGSNCPKCAPPNIALAEGVIQAENRLQAENHLAP